MKLPRGNEALIDPRKLLDYVLSTEHDDGKHKAKLFRELLGIGVDDVQELINALREAAASGTANLGRLDHYGQRFTVDFEYAGPAGSAMVRSAWIIKMENPVPELVTCYIL